MMTRRFALLLLVVSSVSASAQKKVRGETEADWKSMEKSNPRSGLELSNRDVETMNPLRLLIDKRSDLGVSDDQLKQLRDLDAHLTSKNEPLFHALDSLRNEMKPSVRGGDDDRTRALLARNGLTAVLADFRTNYDEGVKSAVALLSEAQQKVAGELLKAQRAESDRILKEKAGIR